MTAVKSSGGAWIGLLCNIWWNIWARECSKSRHIGSDRHVSKHVEEVERPESQSGVEHAVVIPVLVRTNRSLTQFERAVQSVRRILKDDEVLIVVDDGSPTQFQKPIQASCSWPKIILLRHCPNVGPASARNTAMDWCRANRSEIKTVCFLDADCVVPDANWCAAHRAQQKKLPGIACGRTISLNPERWVSIYHDVFGTLNGRMLEDENNLLYGTTCNMSIHFDALPDGFRFDQLFATPAFEDVEFCVRARKAGPTNSITFVSEAVVKHDYSTDVLGLIEQFWRYGQGHHRMLEVHPEYDTWLAVSSPMSNFSVKKKPSD
ncbi:hypothetical protein NDN08_000037 [Rhodosorus marinus]|uniref:Glycosyltransferase 2-like domain-containing protein n=1 Tax=Rhodosorus marinus TaxID=101924 RepID=A0AAV8UGY2_9RHOD|nr:hypothetical protein NDN08_000037 [Rhodosorus marinus]